MKPGILRVFYGHDHSPLDYLKITSVLILDSSGSVALHIVQSSDYPVASPKNT